MKTEYPKYQARMKQVAKQLNKSDIEIIEKYKKECMKYAGEDKVNQRIRYVIQFRDIAEEQLKDFNKSIIEDIYILIKNSEKELIGKNETIKNLKKFIKWYFKDLNLLEELNLKTLTRKKKFNPHKINATTLIKPGEVEAMIRVGKDLKTRAIITLQVETGMRPCEVLVLHWKDLIYNEGDDEAQLRVYSPKTKDDRTIYFKTALIHLLRWRDEFEYPNRTEEDYIFPSPLDRNTKLNNHYLSTLYRRLCVKAKIRNIYPQLCRHTKATELYNKVSGIAHEYMGHNAEMRETYQHITGEELTRQIRETIYNIKEPTIIEKTEIKKLKKDLENLKGNMKILITENMKLLAKKEKSKYIKLFSLATPQLSTHN